MKQIKLAISIILLLFICVSLSCSEKKGESDQGSEKEKVSVPDSNIFLTFKGEDLTGSGWSFFDNHQFQRKGWKINDGRATVVWEQGYLLSYAILPAPLTSYYPIEPGDSVIITSKPYPDYPIVEIENKRLTLFELNFPALLAKENKSIFEYSMRKMVTSKQFILNGDARAYYENGLLLVDSCVNVGLIGRKYETWIKKAIEYSYFDQAIWNNEPFDQLLLNKILATKDLNNGLYRKLIKDYFLQIDLRGKDDFRHGYLKAKERYEGANKDFLLMLCVLGIVKDPKSDIRTYITQFNADCQNLEYKRFVNENYGINEKYSNRTDQIMDVEKKRLNMDNLFHNIEEKLIYIDVWASWCAPCRVEMPYSRRLRRYFEGSDIKFVYLSTDDNFGDWVKANKEEGLKENSYILSRWRNSMFNKIYHISAIPRYILLDKHRRIIDADAPRPSDPKLKKLINDNLLN